MSPDVEARFERIERNLDSLTNITLQRAARMSEIELSMEKLLHSQKQLLTAQVIMSDKVSQLADSQKHSDERLNTLIDIVMRQQSPPPAA